MKIVVDIGVILWYDKIMKNLKGNQMAIDLTIILAALLLFVSPILSLIMLTLIALHAVVTEKDDVDNA